MSRETVGNVNPTWWRRRTQMERSLLTLTILVSLVCLALVIALAVLELQSASELLKNMDTSTEPCDDFYQFACGQFRRKFIPDDKTGLSMFSVIGDELQEQLRMIVDEPVKDSDIRPIVNAKNMYKLCMNESEIERIGSTPVKQLLKKLGGWPLLEGSSWDMGSFSWLKTVYDFRKEGFSVDYLIDFAISIDSKNNSLRVIEIDQGAIAVARDYFVKGLDHPRVKAYFEYMIDISELFGADRSVAKEEMMKSLEFEMALANMSLPSEERRDPEKLYNRMTIGEMQIKFPTIPWFEYFRNILPSKIELTTEEPVIVGVPTYVTQLEQLLQHTEKRVIANYLMWRAAASTVSYLPEAFRKKQLKYITAITGSTEREARWKECSAQASSPLAYSRVRFFSEDRPNYMNYGAIGFVIGHEITHGFDDQGRTFDKEGNLRDWWHEETKEKYLEKAKCIIEQYGNFTDTQVNMKLNGINTQGENIADNGGIKEAYRAYVKWATANGEEARLPGLQQFTPRQLFWVSAASTWCSTYRDETLKNRITTGVHSPAEFRVIGPMSNMPEFAKDFNCPLGSKMNPLKKCTVW
ncbi:unnamed protein product [Nesidiocoris tenuis]|uniref:Peptidase M13 N-terminal domain-containing protein n=1 Tax=Nesidiocoris tenuis TaxID=355587 RepID=A0A6H5G6H9_9HEMI|nr:unnamed protein product [Nesidiocoris tenuis]